MAQPLRIADAAPGAVEVRKVSTSGDRDAFIDLPYRLYAEDPHWVAPLRLERRQHLDPKHNPYFDHAEVALWLAWAGGRAVGRISAQHDRLAAERHPDATGQFGMLEAEGADPAIMAALLEAAEGWLKARGLARVRGPFSLSINDECGLLVEGFNSAPAMMMGHAPPEYGAALERLGYTKAKDLITYELPITTDLSPVVSRTLKRSSIPGTVTARPLRMRRFREEMRALVEVFNDAWSDNWGFVPFTDAEVRHLATSLRPLLRPELVSIAEYQGEPVGVFVALPDLNEAVRGLGGKLLPFNWARLLWRLKTGKVRRFRVPLVGIKKRFQSGFVASEIMYRMYSQVYSALLAGGFTGGEVGWILEDNLPIRRFIEVGNGRQRKTYRIYEKALG